MVVLMVWRGTSEEGLSIPSRNTLLFKNVGQQEALEKVVPEKSLKTKGDSVKEMNHILVCVVGMPGAGKSTVAQVFEQHGYTRIRFGDVTDDEIRRRGWPVNEVHEKKIRERLRQEGGMDAYAKLNETKIRAGLASGNVVVDDLMSYEELVYLREAFPFLVLVGVYASPATRQRRLSLRTVRPLSPDECRSRDHAQLTALSSGGPIALADVMTINERGMKELEKEVGQIVKKLNPLRSSR